MVRHIGIDTFCSVYSSGFGLNRFCLLDRQGTPLDFPYDCQQSNFEVF
jgi:hypothetical protein